VSCVGSTIGAVLRTRDDVQLGRCARSCASRSRAHAAAHPIDSGALAANGGHAFTRAERSAQSSCFHSSAKQAPVRILVKPRSSRPNPRVFAPAAKQTDAYDNILRTEAGRQALCATLSVITGQPRTRTGVYLVVPRDGCCFRSLAAGCVTLLTASYLAAFSFFLAFFSLTVSFALLVVFFFCSPLGMIS
jgi:hypothetical protein